MTDGVSLSSTPQPHRSVASSAESIHQFAHRPAPIAPSPLSVGTQDRGTRCRRLCSVATFSINRHAESSFLGNDPFRCRREFVLERELCTPRCSVPAQQFQESRLFAGEGISWRALERPASGSIAMAGALLTTNTGARASNFGSAQRVKNMLNKG